MSCAIRLDATGTVEIRVHIGEDHYWEVIRRLAKENGTFALSDILGLTNGAAPGTVGTYLNVLHRGGYLEDVGVATCKSRVYRLVKSPRFAPVLRRDGTPGMLNRVQDHIWRAIKMLRTFTVRQLCGVASTEEVTIKRQAAQNYIRNLELAGYVRRHNGESRRGHPGIFSLKPDMNTGPRAPAVTAANIVFDRNLRQVITRSAVAREVTS